MLDKVNIFRKAEPPVNRIVQTIPQIKTVNKYLGEICTVSERNLYSPRNITTTLKNRLGKTLGSEDFNMDENTGKAIGTMILVNPEYRQKNFRFGEILRLSSIMMMLENKIKEFEIFSKNTAVFFHNKYKFEPAIMAFSERNLALKMILENCKNKVEYEDIYKEADKLLKRCAIETEAPSQRNLCKETNDLLKIYMKRIIKKNDYKKHPFSNGMRMILTDKNIQENKDFFNDLFKKHEIDYKI
jgi:hypothetical protein